MRKNTYLSGKGLMADSEANLNNIWNSQDDHGLDCLHMAKAPFSHDVPHTFSIIKTDFSSLSMKLRSIGEM